MDITTVPNKALYKIGQKFLKKQNFEVDDFYDSDLSSQTDFANELISFLVSIGFEDTDVSGEFFYMFLKLNFLEFKKENYQEFERLKRPELKTYEFIWETNQVQSVNIDYQHKYNSYLDESQAYSAVEILRYNGEIYPGDGEEIKYEIYDSDLNEESIGEFKEVKKKKTR